MPLRKWAYEYCKKTPSYSGVEQTEVDQIWQRCTTVNGNLQVCFTFLHKLLSLEKTTAQMSRSKTASKLCGF